MRSAALDKKGEEVVEIDLAGKSIIADSFLIVTGRSKIQVRSIADAIVEAVEAAEGTARVEGYASGGWILIDAGSVVAHIFTPEERAFYNLERLWAEAAERRAQSL